MGKKQQEKQHQTTQKQTPLLANKYLEKPGVILVLTFGAGFLILLAVHVLINTFIRFCQGHLADCVSLECLTTFYPQLWPLYAIAAVAAPVIVLYNLYRFRNAFRNIEDGQKGTSRFATMEEIMRQYPEVPEVPKRDGAGKTIRIPGDGGLPVACKDGKMYLDETATNTLIIAITRAGKGELFSIRMLDSYSRSEKQPSMVILDMKFDLRKMCTKAFQDRGYKVMSINFEEPLHGVGYNPLYLITRYYERGMESDAELLCKAFAYPHFASSGSRSDDNTDFFMSNASSALSATIMAHTLDCLAQDMRENARLAKLYIQARARYEALDSEGKARADAEYAKIAGQAFSARVEQLRYLPDVPFERSNANARKNHMPSVLHLFTNMASDYVDKNTTRLDEYFSMRGSYDRAKAVYSSIGVSGDRTKGSIFSQMLTKLNQYTFGGMEQLTRESSFDPEELGFGEQPVALFLQVPFYDRSKDAIAVSFIDQIYQANARACVQSKNGKCDRRIIFHLDEIAQFPPVENLDSKLSICLGLNMVFNLIIQTDAQLTLKYGEAAKVIKGNCGNQVYLQTSEEETAKLYSSLLGSKTIINLNRVGRRLSFDKTYTETTEERALLTPRELMDLQQGESVILRTMYRKDLDGNKIIPRPIFNSEKEGRAFLYRYEYLTEYFPDADTISETDLNLPRIEAIPADEMMYDYESSFEAAEYKELYGWSIGAGRFCPAPGKEEEEMTAEEEAQMEAWKKAWDRFEELRSKGLYEWDIEVPLTVGQCTSNYQRQFLDVCRELDSKYQTDICSGHARMKKGEVLLAVMKDAVPLQEKQKLLRLLAV